MVLGIPHTKNVEKRYSNIMKGDKMQIEYKTQKDLPCEELYQLFLAVGWASENATTPDMIDHFNIGFLHSTFVFSAWADGKLVGCVRVLSDLKFRSVIYDLAVLPQYQRKGIGTKLVQLCKEACPDSNWLVLTDAAEEFYKKLGFSGIESCALTMQGKWCTE